MAKLAKKKDELKTSKRQTSKAYFESAGEVIEQRITQTLEKNFMPYAMSVIVSRAIPEIDGFKPSHRKILYTMYNIGLLTGAKTKSANVVGQTMRLNPHGDAAIYETLVRLSRGNEALLHAYIDSKGNFGKAYSRDMAYAASRYTEVKLESICNELFGDINKSAVDFVDNYDSTMKEPTLLPTSFPAILVNSNEGIAVGMASKICSFNLREVCDTTIGIIKNPEHDATQTLKAPDFSGGGEILYNAEEIQKIYNTGRGSVRVRSKYIYDKENNIIEISEIPPTTTVEAIIDKIAELIKDSKIKEISDVRDETDLNGLKITIDLKRGVDADKLMQRLFKRTPLEDSFSCNFNILIEGTPRVMGIYEILTEWIAFREQCVKRRVYFDLAKNKDKLHLLKGLQKILLDIDKAIRIVRETEEETEVVPNLMIGFGIDEIQADYVAEIKLRHLNREYILKRTQEIEKLIAEIAEMEGILSSSSKIRNIIVDELRDVSKKYGIERKSSIIYNSFDEVDEEEEVIPSYPVNIFFTKEGYFKKITPLSLRMSGEQKLKETDQIVKAIETTNTCELLFFTDKQQVYKARACDFDDTKSSAMGDFIPAKLQFDPGENVKFMLETKDFTGNIVLFFENGKAAKVPLSAYDTKTRRKKLTGAYCDKSVLVNIFNIENDTEFMLTSSLGRMLIIHSGAIALKATKATQGVAAMTLKKGQRVIDVKILDLTKMTAPHRYRTKNIPAAGVIPKEEDFGEQILIN